MGKLRIGTVYRYARPYSAAKPEIDGLPNYFHVTNRSAAKFALLESGINAMAATKADDGAMVAAVLISSSPHNVGHDRNPWHDAFEPDRGFVRYGDNKRAGTAPESVRGNALLLNQFRVHTSPDPAIRRLAVPLIFFLRVAIAGRAKGNLMFQGFGVVSGATLVTQVHPATQEAFANYLFEFTVASDDESRRY